MVAKFASLAKKRLARLEGLIVRLEQGVDEAGARDARREIHTLKGEARILGLARTAALAHLVEGRMHRALAGVPSAEDVRVLLAGLDRLGAAIAEIHDGEEPAIDVDAIARELGLEGGEAPVTSVTKTASPAARTASPPPETRARALDGGELDELTRILGELRANQARWRQTTAALRAIDDRAAGAAEELRALAREAHASARAHVFDEGVLIERLDHLISELRVVPIDPHLARHTRAVRDLADALGKRARLDIEERGARVERAVLDVLDEVAVHLLRNAVDHGIEAPEERARAGKPEVGSITLAVRPLGAHVELCVADDGRGVDPEALRRAATAAGIMSEEAAQAASDEDMTELLFAPGFTTRDDVSEVSGRGVGLDAVRARVASIGGTVTVDLAPGRGAAFRALVPARVTMTRVLIVTAGGARIALPAEAVRAVLGLARADVEAAGDTLFVRLEGEPSPLLDLARAMGEPGGGVLPDPIHAVVVARPRGDRVFFVDRALGARDAVQVAPGRLLEGHAFVRSIAILDDGEPALAVDADALPSVRISARRLSLEVGAAPAPAARASILVVDDSEVTRDVIGETLRSAGFDVIEAVDGRQALEKLGATRPSLVITDLQMPVMDGFTFVRAVRDGERDRDLPIVVVSTLGAEADRRQAAHAGADAYLRKSELGREALLEVVARFVRVGGAGST